MNTTGGIGFYTGGPPSGGAFGQQHQAVPPSGYHPLSGHSLLPHTAHPPMPGGLSPHIGPSASSPPSATFSCGAIGDGATRSVKTSDRVGPFQMSPEQLQSEQLRIQLLLQQQLQELAALQQQMRSQGPTVMGGVHGQGPNYQGQGGYGQDGAAPTPPQGQGQHFLPSNTPFAPSRLPSSPLAHLQQQQQQQQQLMGPPLAMGHSLHQGGGGVGGSLLPFNVNLMGAPPQHDGGGRLGFPQQQYHQQGHVFPNNNNNTSNSMSHNHSQRGVVVGGVPMALRVGGPAAPVGAPAGMVYVQMPPQANYNNSNSKAGQQQGGGKQAAQRAPVDVQLWGYAVCDPHHPFLHRVPIPPTVCAVTKGLLCYNNDVQSSSTRPCGSTVCIGFSSLSAMCPFGAECPHFHVDKAYLAKARSVLEPLCCAYHNDFFSREMVASNVHPTVHAHRYALLLEDKSGVEISPAFLAFTIGLDMLPTKGKGAAACKYINVKKHLCRLHLEGKCKWTKDCSHVHVCRESYKHLVGAPRQSIQTLLTSTDLTHAAIADRLRANAKSMAYLKSPAGMTLVTWVLENGGALEGVAALVAVGCQFSEDQAAAVQNLFPGYSIPLRLVTPVPAMLRRFFKPVVADAGAVACSGAEPTFTNGKAPLAGQVALTPPQQQHHPSSDVGMSQSNGQSTSQSSHSNHTPPSVAAGVGFGLAVGLPHAPLVGDIASSSGPSNISSSSPMPATVSGMAVGIMSAEAPSAGLWGPHSGAAPSTLLPFVTSPAPQLALGVVGAPSGVFGGEEGLSGKQPPTDYAAGIEA